MPDTVVTTAPFFVKHPLIRLGTTGSSVEISCPSTQLTVAVDQDENTVDTFCGSYTSYKSPKWTITATVTLSYGPTGTWTLLQPMFGTQQSFQVQPDNAAASATNPNMSGTAIVKYMSFIDAAPGEASEVDLELAVIGQPLFGSVAPALADAAAGPAPEPAVA